jgi:hypothetical protein
MTFPSFGDAADYERLGRACADALGGAGGSVFDDCYHPIRPRGIALLMAAPYLLTRDAVAADYIMLALNVAFLGLAVAALAGGLAADPDLLPGHTGLLWAGAFVALLLNLVSHLPIRLGDLPSLAMFLVAVGLGMRTVSSLLPARRLAGRYAAAGACCAGAVLLKLTYFVHALLFLALLLLLDRNQATDRRRLACGVAFLAGFSPVALQFGDVFLHSGRAELFESAFIKPFHQQPRGQAIEAVFHTVPAIGAYTVSPAEPISFATLVALRLYRGLLGFEWAVYGGLARRGPVWQVTTPDRIRAWTFVGLWAALTAAVARRGHRGLGLLGTTAAAVAVITALMGHTELRYFALPRAVWWLILGCGGLWMLDRSRAAHLSGSGT